MRAWPKRIEIDVIQYDGANAEELETWSRLQCVWDGNVLRLHPGTLQTTRVEQGDWLARDPSGQYDCYMIPQAVFEEVYECI